MTSYPDQYPQEYLLDTNQTRERMVAQHEQYLAAEPFPHAVFDNFISDRVVDEVLQQFPTPEADIQWRQILARSEAGDKVQFNKQGMPQLFMMPPYIRQLIWELNSGTFIRSLERLTGISDLIPDPSLRGGGLHQILPGGVLGVHADFTHHVEYKLERRVNLLLYFNRDWQDDYEGHLELWNADASRCIKRVRPTAGRCVVFSTDATSFHGHPRPLACPEGTTRKSIAIYYYTLGRDDKSVQPTAQTDWQALPDVALPPLV
jgi:Rps23 Pro-64 3,4-dihydroxylase Tpa1-like proline 4-hydroxylase